MPLFMAMAGYLFLYTWRPERGYKAFLTSKVRRLLVPYVSTSIIVILLKLVSERAGGMNVENPVTYMSFVQILYSNSAGAFLWFIWALWWMFVISPFFKTKQSRLALFVVMAIVAYIPFDAPRTFCLVNTQRYGVYFVAGMLLYDWKSLLPESLAATISTLALMIAAEVLWLCTGVQFAREIVPYISIVALTALAGVATPDIKRPWSTVLFELSAASYIIYLFHTTFEGFVKSTLLRYALAGEAAYYAVATAAILAGIIIPLVLYKYILRRSAVTRFLFGL